MGQQSNNQLLIKELIRQEMEENTEYEDVSMFFEFFAASQVVKEYELSDEEVQNGIKGSGLDGGCDAVYIFLNNILMTEDSINSISGIKEANITLHIIQAKHTTSFGEDALMKWKTISDNLLKFENDISSFNTRYNADILMSFSMFKTLYIKLIRSKPKVNIIFSYVSLATELHPNVEAQSKELKEIVKKLFPTPNTAVDVSFIDAEKLMEIATETTDHNFILPLVESPIAIGQQKNYITLVKLSDYFNFITDEDNTIKAHMFEANVRDYQGKNSVNTEIKETLVNGTGENFWWLNNGITVLATDAHQPTGKEIVITDPEIVNGLQTSNEIYNYFINYPEQLSNEQRSVLVRVIVPENETSRDRIILATNNQTSIPKASLRASDPIHWQIEMYFKSRGLFYDRRKNYYKNQGKKSHEIVSVSFLAQCLISLLLEQPEQARARPSTLLTDDEAYSKLYERDHNLSVYFNAAKIGKKVDKIIKEFMDLLPPEKSDILFYVIYAVVAKALNKEHISSNDLSGLNIEDFSDEGIKNCCDMVLKSYGELGGNDRVAKGSLLLPLIKKHLFS